jgi:hypothetical protein
VKVAMSELLVTVRVAGQPAQTLLDGRASRAIAAAGATL